VTRRQFGISTALFQRQRLEREHILEIAASGFNAIDLVATRAHVDYHNVSAVADVQQWLGEAGLSLHAIHAPAESSLASTNPDVRASAVAETERALHIARRIETKVLIVHVGTPRWMSKGPGTESRVAARRSLEELAATAGPLGVRLALEVIPNELSRAGSLVHFIEHDLEDLDVGVCLDCGHAHLDGDLLDAIDTVSEHLLAVEIHDNHRRTDDHLVPFEGTIDWPAALTAARKIGYEDTLVFELRPRGASRDALKKARQAREQIDRLLD
jgi:sugar phosphate isomerase/epimerase